MRKNGLFIAVIAMFMGLLLGSCSKDNSNNSNDGKIDPSTIAAANLVAYFPFDGNGNASVGGLTPDASSKGVTYVAGRRGTGAYQGADNAYLKYVLPTGSKLKNLKAYSVSLWVKIVATVDGGPEPMIFQMDGTTDWFWGNLFLLQNRNPVPSDTTNLANYFWKDDAASWKGQRIDSRIGGIFDHWAHLIATYDNVSSKFCFYINGVKFKGGEGYEDRKQSDGGPALGDMKFNSANNLYFGGWAARIDGRMSDDWAGFYKGNIDEFRLYDRALTATEAKDLYDAEVTQVNP